MKTAERPRWQGRVLPATMLLMGLILMEKMVGLAEHAAASEGDHTTPAAAAVIVPQVSPASMTTLQPSSQTVTAAEMAILQDLRKRRDGLNERERQINQKADLLQAAEEKLKERMDELAVLQRKIDEKQALQHERDAANWATLVKMYEDMKPGDAAAIFNILDMSALLEVLDHMEERKASAVLAAMSPERARSATQMLVQKRTAGEAASDAVSLAGHPG